MRFMKWAGILAAVALVISCFLPWVSIDTKNIIVWGMESEGTSFGKPGYLHLILTGIFLAFNLITRIWAKRMNLLVTAINLAWAVRNFFVISTCQGGECPGKHPGIYLMLFSSIVMLISAMFPDMKVPQKRP